MKNKISRRMVKVTASVLIVMVLLCVWAPSANADESRICRKALSKCFVDAVIILIFSGPQTAAIYASGCLNGYIWCLTYYVEF